MAVDPQWVTHAEAAAIVGCSRNTIDRAQAAGRIERRHPVGRKTPTLSRASVERFAEAWRAEQVERQQQGPTRSREYGPPKDGDVWLDTRTAALVIGCTPQHMARLARRGRIPASTNGDRKRFWFRRHHVEQYAAARALEWTIRTTRGAMT